MVNYELVARVCHEANRAVQVYVGEDQISPHYDEAPDWQKDSAREGVKAALRGRTPEELHDDWCESKFKDGWTYGFPKDPVKKIHPCLVPYIDLPEEQKVKDLLFLSIVNAFKDADKKAPKIVIEPSL